MTIPANALVFDTGPLRHFSMMGWLGVLKFLADDRPAFMPDVVEKELNDAVLSGAAGPDQVLKADWIQVHRSTDLVLMSAQAGYEDRLVANGKNRGECGVLALGKTYGCELVIDDSTARTIAAEDGLRVTTTVELLCAGIRAGQLTTPMVEKLADDLLENEYFLPFGEGGFRSHVLSEGLLDYQDLQGP
jgi:predicted nucleic acid-binding protein